MYTQSSAAPLRRAHRIRKITTRQGQVCAGRLPPVSRLKVLKAFPETSLQCMDAPRDPRFVDEPKERGWDNRCAAGAGSRCNDVKFTHQKSFFDRTPAEVAPKPAKKLRQRKQLQQELTIVHDLGPSGWNERAGVTVSGDNHHRHVMMREYFDRPLERRLDGTYSVLQGRPSSLSRCQTAPRAAWSWLSSASAAVSPMARTMPLPQSSCQLPRCSPQASPTSANSVRQQFSLHDSPRALSAADGAPAPGSDRGQSTTTTTTTANIIHRPRQRAAA